MGPVRLAVAGAGAIGKRHIGEVDANPDVTLASIVDPARSGRSWPLSTVCRSINRWLSCSSVTSQTASSLPPPTRSTSMAGWSAWPPVSR